MATLKTKVGDFANIFKGFIGTNYLTLPYGFLISGLGFGFIGLFFVAVFTDYCCLLMVRCKHHLINEVCDSLTDHSKNKNSKTDAKVATLKTRMLRHLNYADLVKLTFNGRWAIYVINFCIMVTQFGFCMNYFIVIGNTIQTLFPLTVTNSSADIIQSVLLEDAKNIPQQKLSPQLQVNTTDMVNAVTLAPATVLAPNFTNINIDIVQVSTAPPLQLLVLVPLPLLILFTYFREVRQLTIVSFLANTCACMGFVAVVIYILLDFQVSDGLEWWIPSGLLVYIGQATGAFEAVALILPIEASMHGTWHLFGPFVHGAVVLMTLMIAVMGAVGYIRYGPTTQQLILLNLPPGQPITMAINILLIVGIACTYPLQIVPVVQILEGALFGAKMEPVVRVKEVDGKGESTPLLSSSEDSCDPLQLSVAYYVPQAIPAWKRNVLRTLIAVVICGMAVLLRNVLAYSLALVGALGSCPLAYIFPCLMHIKLLRHKMNIAVLLLNVFIIIFGLVFCVVGVITAISNIIEKA